MSADPMAGMGAPLPGMDPTQIPGMSPEADPNQDAGQSDPFALADEARKLVDYTVKWDATRRAMLGRNLMLEINSYLEATAGRRSNCEQWRRDWENLPVASTRWEGAAQVCSPLTHIYTKSHATRLNTQLRGDPPLTVVARKQEAIDAAPQIEQAMAASLEEASWAQRAGSVHQELPVVGNVFVRLMYEEVYRRRPVVETELDDGLLEQLVGAGVPMDQALAQAVQKDDQGRPKVFLTWQRELREAGPRYRVIAWEDGIILPPTVRDPKDARGIGERVMIRGSELIAGAKEGKFFQDAVDKILQQRTDPEPTERSERLDAQGINPSHDAEPMDADPSFRSYDCWELCWRIDANDDDEEEWVIVTLQHDTGLVLRLQYLPYEHGEPYYSLFRYIERTDELWGMSVSELVACLQDAHTAWLNQTLDAEDLALNMRGNFFYSAESGLRPDKWVFELGKPIKVDNVAAISPMVPPTLPPDHWQTHQVLKDLGDLLTATSNPALGQVTDANKTLGEVQLVNAAANLIFEEIASGVALQWADLWDQHRWLMAQYGEGGQVKFRKSAAPDVTIQVPDPSDPTGQTMQAQPAVQGPGGQLVPAPNGVAFLSIPADMLLAEVDIVPTGLKQLGDANARLQQAQVVLQTILTHPLTAQSPEALLIALDFFLQAVRFPQREKVLEAVHAQMALQAAAAQQQAQIANAAAAQAGSNQGQELANQANQADQQAQVANQQGQLQTAQMAQQPAPAPPAVHNL